MPCLPSLGPQSPPDQKTRQRLRPKKTGRALGQPPNRCGCRRHRLERERRKPRRLSKLRRAQTCEKDRTSVLHTWRRLRRREEQERTNISKQLAAYWVYIGVDASFLTDFVGDPLGLWRLQEALDTADPKKDESTEDSAHDSDDTNSTASDSGSGNEDSQGDTSTEPQAGPEAKANAAHRCQRLLPTQPRGCESTRLSPQGLGLVFHSRDVRILPTPVWPPPRTSERFRTGIPLCRPTFGCQRDWL